MFALEAVCSQAGWLAESRQPAALIAGQEARAQTNQPKASRSAGKLEPPSWHGRATWRRSPQPKLVSQSLVSHSVAYSPEAMTTLEQSSASSVSLSCSWWFGCWCWCRPSWFSWLDS